VTATEATDEAGSADTATADPDADEASGETLSGEESESKTA
jgi:hypothetical protein